MFQAAQQLFTEEEAEIINEAFQKMKPEVKEEGFMKNTLEMIKNMMPPRLTDALSDMSPTVEPARRVGGERHPDSHI